MENEEKKAISEYLVVLGNVIGTILAATERSRFNAGILLEPDRMDIMIALGNISNVSSCLSDLSGSEDTTKKYRSIIYQECTAPQREADRIAKIATVNDQIKNHMSSFIGDNEELKGKERSSKMAEFLLSQYLMEHPIDDQEE